MYKFDTIIYELTPKGEHNGNCIDCLLDTGAQLSCMSAEFASRAKIDHLIDSTITSTAQGIGNQKVSLV